jgi:hypothetical protein
MKVSDVLLSLVEGRRSGGLSSSALSGVHAQARRGKKCDVLSSGSRKGACRRAGQAGVHDEAIVRARCCALLWRQLWERLPCHPRLMRTLLVSPGCRRVPQVLHNVRLTPGSLCTCFEPRYGERGSSAHANRGLLGNTSHGGRHRLGDLVEATTALSVLAMTTARFASWTVGPRKLRGRGDECVVERASASMSSERRVGMQEG